MKTAIIIVAGMLIAGQCAAQTDPSFVFRGHQAGQQLAPMDRITTTSHFSYGKWDFYCQNIAGEQWLCLEIDPATGSKTKSIGGVPINDLAYVARSRKFSMLLMTFPSDSYRALKDMLIGKYGAPASQTVETYHNRMNAEFQGEVLTWAFAEGNLTFSQVGDSIDEGQLSFESEADKAIDTEARRKAAEAAGKSAF